LAVDYFKEEGSMERRLIDADGGAGVAVSYHAAAVEIPGRA
jgi:hypothetical protein